MEFVTNQIVPRWHWFCHNGGQLDQKQFSLSCLPENLKGMSNEILLVIPIETGWNVEHSECTS